MSQPKRIRLDYEARNDSAMAMVAARKPRIIYQLFCVRKCYSQFSIYEVAALEKFKCYYLIKSREVEWDGVLPFIFRHNARFGFMLGCERNPFCQLLQSVAIFNNNLKMMKFISFFSLVSDNPRVYRLPESVRIGLNSCKNETLRSQRSSSEVVANILLHTPRPVNPRVVFEQVHSYTELRPIMNYYSENAYYLREEFKRNIRYGAYFFTGSYTHSDEMSGDEVATWENINWRELTIEEKQPNHIIWTNTVVLISCYYRYHPSLATLIKTKRCTIYICCSVFSNIHIPCPFFAACQFIEVPVAIALAGLARLEVAKNPQPDLKCFCPVKFDCDPQ